MDLTGKELVTTIGSYDLYKTNMTDVLNAGAPKGFTVYFLTGAEQPTEEGVYVVYDYLGRPTFESADPNTIQTKLHAYSLLGDMGT
jgi:hypothetical protein